ncbi:MAG: hypothetical protein HC797_08640 [Anaerolineales bacterium]|nr:hypothetical protein [Anaerolineales bacterium]
MLRSILIYFSKATWAQNLITNWGYAWKIASRFVPGTKLTDALQVARDLNTKRYVTSLNQLGEHTNTPDDAQQVADEIYAILDALGADTALQTNLSIKLTQVGLGLDENLCTETLERILARAKRNNIFIRIDMEDTPYTEKTINLYYTMRAKGYDNVGLVIQAYLYRSEADLHRLVMMTCASELSKGHTKNQPTKPFRKKRM